MKAIRTKTPREIEKNAIVAQAELAFVDAQLAQCPDRKRFLLAKTRSLLLSARQIADPRSEDMSPGSVTH